MSRAGWAGGEASLELNAARTLPVSHVNLHLLRSSSIGMTDRIQLSSHLLRDLAAAPNIRLTWSVFQRPWLAAAFELGTGADLGVLEPDFLPLETGDSRIKPYFMIGGLGTLYAQQRHSVTLNLRYAYFFRPVGYGDATSSARGAHRFSPTLNFNLGLSARDVIYAEVMYAPIPGMWLAGYDHEGVAAALWYAHAFEHLRIMAGVTNANRDLELSFEEGLPVTPVIELWWDFIPP